jgi:hypothetical protein
VNDERYQVSNLTGTVSAAARLVLPRAAWGRKLFGQSTSLSSQQSRSLSLYIGAGYEPLNTVCISES